MQLGAGVEEADGDACGGLAMRSGHDADRSQQCRLADLDPGACAVIVGVSESAGRAVARRLVELGFSAGTGVEVVRRAPLRDPVVYRLRGYDMCLRRAQAGLIRVRVAS